MRILLDTCEFLWYISASPKLPPQVRAAIENTSNDIYLSPVSVWEASVKHMLGKLPLPDAPEKYLPAARSRHSILSLPLDEESVTRLPALPPIHNDPFDRMLICQALQHQLTLASSDHLVRQYPVAVL